MPKRKKDKIDWPRYLASFIAAILYQNIMRILNDFILTTPRIIITSFAILIYNVGIIYKKK